MSASETPVVGTIPTLHLKINRLYGEAEVFLLLLNPSRSTESVLDKPVPMHIARPDEVLVVTSEYDVINPELLSCFGVPENNVT